MNGNILVTTWMYYEIHNILDTSAWHPNPERDQSDKTLVKGNVQHHI